MRFVSIFKKFSTCAVGFSANSPCLFGQGYNYICRIGAEISEELSNVTAHILSMYGFDNESGLSLEDTVLSDNITTVSVSQDAKPGKPEIDEVIAAVNDSDSRKEGSERDYKYVENTVAHIQYGDESYILTGIGMRNVFKSVLAFLLVNNLLSRELIFLTDGAQDLRSHIQSVFQFHNPHHTGKKQYGM